MLLLVCEFQSRRRESHHASFDLFGMTEREERDRERITH